MLALIRIEKGSSSAQIELEQLNTALGACRDEEAFLMDREIKHREGTLCTTQ